jgi:hypothetical protein
MYDGHKEIGKGHASYNANFSISFSYGSYSNNIKNGKNYRCNDLYFYLVETVNQECNAIIQIEHGYIYHG